MDAAEKELEKVEIQDEVTDEICDVCGRNMVIKYGMHMEDSLHVLDFRNAEIPNRIMKKSVWHVRNVERMLCGKPEGS